MLRVGLTGGIGSGKSTVAGYFAQRDIKILDADSIAHELTQVGAAGYEPIVKFFGKEILTSTGELDRKKMRKIIFAEGQNKLQLERILHPLIFKTLREQTHQLSSPYCIIVIPLLVETGISHDFLDRICVVDAEESNQIQWAAKRDQSAPQDIEKIIKKQCLREERLRIADDIIYNNGDLAWLKAQVQKLHNQYLQMSAA